MRWIPESEVGRWTAGGALLILTIGAVALLAIPDRDKSGEADWVQVAALPSTQTLPANVRPSDAPMAQIPIQPTRENGHKAEEQASTILEEKRDGDWATRSEAAILDFMRSVPYLQGPRKLEVTCAASACEFTGIADPDPATRSMKPVWEALERDTATADLRSHGLERTAVVFDTGRSGDEFKIYYQRVLH